MPIDFITDACHNMYEMIKKGDDTMIDQFSAKTIGNTLLVKINGIVLLPISTKISRVARSLS